MDGQCGILMNHIWTKARKMMNLQKWYLEDSDHPHHPNQNPKEPSYQKMSQIGQTMSELEQKMRHGAWPTLIWTAPLFIFSSNVFLIPY